MNTLLKNWMETFEHGYVEKDEKQLEIFINQMFNIDEQLVVIGTDLNEWYNSLEDIQKFIKKQWQKSIEFNFEKAHIQEFDEHVFIYSTTTVEWTEKVSERFTSVKAKTLKLLESEIDDELKILESARLLSETLEHVNQETFNVPMRFSVILKKVEGVYKAHHMQFTYDAVFLWQYRFENLELVQPYYEMETLNNAPEVRELLSKFQKGYTTRDLNSIDSFMTLFVDDDNMINIGTDADEFLVGPNDLKEIIESDWTYWGDFEINITGAIVVEYNNFAYFSTKGRLKKEHTKAVLLDSAVQVLKWNLEDFKNENHLKKALKSILDFEHEMKNGEVFCAPMRFTGFCIKENGQWRFAHVQYSDYMKKPEKFN